MCLVSLKGAIRSRQVHQLKQDTHVGCGLPTLFNITDITNSLAEPHFKVTMRVKGELLKVNTRKLSPSNTRPSTNTILPQQKRTLNLNCRVWVNKINNNILLLNKRKKQPPPTIQVKARSEKVFLLNSGR